jgi:hypothetical protein
MISEEKKILNKKKKIKRLKKQFIKTNESGLYKNKKTGFIINRNKNELILVKAAMNNAKKNIENEEKVKKLENDIQQLKELLFKVVEERN